MKKILLAIIAVTFIAGCTEWNMGDCVDNAKKAYCKYSLDDGWGRYDCTEALKNPEYIEAIHRCQKHYYGDK